MQLLTDQNELNGENENHMNSSYIQHQHQSSQGPCLKQWMLRSLFSIALQNKVLLSGLSLDELKYSDEMILRGIAKELDFTFVETAKFLRAIANIKDASMNIKSNVVVIGKQEQRAIEEAKKHLTCIRKSISELNNAQIVFNHSVEKCGDTIAAVYDTMVALLVAQLTEWKNNMETRLKTQQKEFDQPLQEKLLGFMEYQSKIKQTIMKQNESLSDRSLSSDERLFRIMSSGDQNVSSHFNFEVAKPTEICLQTCSLQKQQLLQSILEFGSLQFQKAETEIADHQEEQPQKPQPPSPLQQPPQQPQYLLPDEHEEHEVHEEHDEHTVHEVYEAHDAHDVHEGMPINDVHDKRDESDEEGPLAICYSPTYNQYHNDEKKNNSNHHNSSGIRTAQPSRVWRPGTSMSHTISLHSLLRRERQSLSSSYSHAHAMIIQDIVLQLSTQFRSYRGLEILLHRALEPGIEQLGRLIRCFHKLSCFTDEALFQLIHRYICIKMTSNRITFAEFELFDACFEEGYLELDLLRNMQKHGMLLKNNVLLDTEAYVDQYFEFEQKEFCITIPCPLCDTSIV